jgi:mono/diheme cytochrome c family protein
VRILGVNKWLIFATGSFLQFTYPKHQRKSMRALLLLALMASPLFAQDTAPGLKLTLKSGEVTDSRVARLVALRSSQSEAVSPFLPAGPFTATYTGVLKLDRRSRLIFSATGQGALKLTVDGDVLLEGKGDLSTLSMEQERINKGERSFLLEYSSPPDGVGNLRLFWKERSFDVEPIPPHVFSHAPDAELRESATWRQGRELFARHHCSKCHRTENAAMPELQRDSPDLNTVGARLKPDWMAAWLRSPHKLRSGATMPDLSLDEQGAADIAAYLATLGKAPAATTGNAKVGGEHFAALGCIACHQRPDAEPAADDERLHLREVANKWQPGALVAFLQQPSAHYKWISMPNFSLSADEAKDIAAFLLERAAAPAPSAMMGDVSRGQSLAKKVGCASCHAMPIASELKASNFASISSSWVNRGCVADSTGARGNAPDFAFNDSQRAALKAAWPHLNASLKRHAPAESVTRIMRSLNCVACHQRDNAGNAWNAHIAEVDDIKSHKTAHLAQTRPSITWIGDKLRGDWLTRLFKGELDYATRPWLEARMPAFPAYADLLAEGLAAEHGVSSDLNYGKAEWKAEGEKLAGVNGGFACVACHAIGNKKAIAEFEAGAVNLLHSAERLRGEFYQRWMRNPQRIEPITTMPRFGGEDGTTPLTETLDGHADHQFEAIWAYLQSLRQ